jgi:hypothetical protein
MTLTIRVMREGDGTHRWLARVDTEELGFRGVAAYGPSRDEAAQAAARLCRSVISERIEHGELESLGDVEFETLSGPTIKLPGGGSPSGSSQGGAHL